MKKNIILVALVLSSNLQASFWGDETDIVDQESPKDSQLWEDLEDPLAKVSGVRPWQSSNYNEQANALGWTPESFTIPDNLRPQVDFWIKIYSQLPQDRGLIHDTEDLTKVYLEVDFSDINQRGDINKFRKEYLRQKRVELLKNQIIESLFRLDRKVAQLTEQELQIKSWFQNDPDPKKFKKAQERVRFQLGQKDKVIQGIYFSGRYLEIFEDIFRQEGLPIELARLPFVESSYNIMARSRVGASGLWQLMPSVLNKKESAYKSVDVRNYPVRAAKIAARVLKANYRMLKAWPLAVTGYNHGPTGVSKLSIRCKSKDIYDLAQAERCGGKRLGFASRNFYPSFLAVLAIEKAATQYYGQVFWANSLQQVEWIAPVSLTYKELLNWFDQDDLKAQLYNPHLLAEVRKGKQLIARDTFLMLPNNKIEIADRWVQEKINQETQAPIFGAKMKKKKIIPVKIKKRSDR